MHTHLAEGTASFQGHFSRTTLSLIVIVALMLLMMMLAYPLGYDQAAFLVGGDAIFEKGAVPYRDFIDTKPPVIFYLYGLASWLFGHNDWGIRLFDILYTAAGVYYLYSILKRTSTEWIAVAASAIYLIYYVGSGYWFTAQAESFALIPSLLIFDLALRLREDVASRYGILSGVAAGLLFLLKFTLVTYCGGVLLWVLLGHFSKRTKIRYTLGFALGSGLVVGLYLLQLSLAGGLDRFFESIQWVREYSAIEPLTDPASITRQFFIMAQQITAFSFNFTPLFLAAVAIYLHVRRDPETEPSPMLSLALLGFAGHMLGITMERKYFPYHLTRAFWLLTPFVAIGLTQVLPIVERRWKRAVNIGGVGGFIRALGIAAMLLIACFYSPLLRVVSQSLRWTWLELSGGNIEQSVQDHTEGYFYADQHDVARLLKDKLAPTDEIFLWGNGVGIYHYLDRNPPTIALTNTPLLTSWTRPDWRSTMLSQLQQAKPKYIIIETGDVKTFITASEEDSRAHFEKWTELKNWRDQHYKFYREVGHFLIYERKN